MSQKGILFPILLICLWVGFGVRASAQPADCGHALHGRVVSEGNHRPIPFAFISIAEGSASAWSDSLGQFQFCQLPAGKHRLVVKQLGYDSLSLMVETGRRKGLVLHLVERSTWLTPIDVQGKGVAHREKSNSSVLQKEQLDRTRGAAFGELVRRLPGVSVLQSGPTVLKPVLQGLTGHRIAILSNGTKLEGQQWGFDHGPEIDAGSVDRIKVIKGAQAVRYGSDAIGGVILTEQTPIGTELQSVYLQSTSTFATNGKGASQRLSAENRFGNKQQFGWRAIGSGRFSGSYSTPKYIIGNTGVRESSLSFLLTHRSNRWVSQLWASGYTTSLGVFSGSHLTSPEAIRQAIHRPDSSYRYAFDYRIQRPMQKLSHFLASAKTEYYLSDNQRLIFSYHHQEDHRKEYDIIRKTADCATCPQVRFQLQSQQAEAAFLHENQHYTGRTAVVGLTQGNVVQGKILIPNFRLYQGGAYSIHSWKQEKWEWEIGARTEIRKQQIYRYLGQVFDSPAQLYFSYMANGGVLRQLDVHWQARLNTQFSVRPPNVNELYSNGVHHGTASFEMGQEGLKPEKIWNTHFSLEHRSAHWQLTFNGFLTWSPNFIYLTPVGDSFITTIRGSFPFYRYQAAEIWMKGLDFYADYQLNANVGLYTKAAAIRSWDASNHTFLIFQPADRLESGIRLQRNLNHAYAIQITVGSELVSKQYRTPAQTDFAEAPVGYILWNSQIVWKKTSGKFRFDLSIEGQNLMNKTYRDYMNRFRYFSYDLGRNVMVRLSIPFGHIIS